MLAVLANAECTVGASTFGVLFQQQHVQAFAGLHGGIDATETAALALNSDVAANGIEADSEVSIDGAPWYVQAVRPAGAGLSALVLSQEAP